MQGLGTYPRVGAGLQLTAVGVKNLTSVYSASDHQSNLWYFVQYGEVSVLCALERTESSSRESLHYHLDIFCKHGNGALIRNSNHNGM